MATSATQAGSSERSMRSLLVLRGYIRDGDLFREHALEGLL
jgi:hypothetical protein